MIFFENNTQGANVSIKAEKEKTASEWAIVKNNKEEQRKYFENTIKKGNMIHTLKRENVLSSLEISWG